MCGAADGKGGSREPYHSLGLPLWEDPFEYAWARGLRVVWVEPLRERWVLWYQVMGAIIK